MAFRDLNRPPLDHRALNIALTRGGSLWTAVEVVETAESTNALVAERARRGAREGLILVAEHQTAGRGRLGRGWVTPPGAALTFSALLEPAPVPPARWTWLPLLVGVAVAEGLRRAIDVQVTLKWPNDVLFGDRKTAGVLVERVETDAGALAVVGVGVNVSTRTDELPGPQATSLALETGTVPDRTVVLREVLRTVAALYADWRRESGDASAGLRDAYRRRCATLGSPVRVALPGGGHMVGFAHDVDTEGRLVVRTEEGSHALGAGDVVHVRDAGATGDVT